MEPYAVTSRINHGGLSKLTHYPTSARRSAPNSGEDFKLRHDPIQFPKKTGACLMRTVRFALILLAFSVPAPWPSAHAADVICYNCPPEWADWASMLKAIKADLH